ncbi:hypothetical protein DNTS_010281 [Danionella cerebrum]|uniref:Uncharacterized protein n=1 Tax=Danionella cerebrum TaxID=2873325 RepID=A0A553MRA0_9TELE|nr:hypothetical protein DNTS_010281 [Danionella translucida]
MKLWSCCGVRDSSCCSITRSSCSRVDGVTPCSVELHWSSRCSRTFHQRLLSTVQEQLINAPLMETLHLKELEQDLSTLLHAVSSTTLQPSISVAAAGAVGSIAELLIDGPLYQHRLQTQAQTRPVYENKAPFITILRRVRGHSLRQMCSGMNDEVSRGRNRSLQASGTMNLKSFEGLAGKKKSEDLHELSMIERPAAEGTETLSFTTKHFRRPSAKPSRSSRGSRSRLLPPHPHSCSERNFRSIQYCRKAIPRLFPLLAGRLVRGVGKQPRFNSCAPVHFISNLAAPICLPLVVESVSVSCETHMHHARGERWDSSERLTLCVTGNKPRVIYQRGRTHSHSRGPSGSKQGQRYLFIGVKASGFRASGQSSPAEAWDSTLDKVDGSS